MIQNNFTKCPQIDSIFIKSYPPICKLREKKLNFNYAYFSFVFVESPPKRFYIVRKTLI